MSHTAQRDTAGELLEVQVRSIRLEADQVVSLELVNRDGYPLPAWESGAHVDVVLPSGLKRQYSLCGEQGDPRVYRIAVLRQEAGRGGSMEVHDGIRVGQILEVHGPRNHFPLGNKKRHVFIAGGIGITPILAHARAAAARGDEWKLIYGARSRASMAFVDEFKQLGNGQVQLVPEDTDGFINVDQLAIDLPTDSDVYCCGPAGLMDLVDQKLPSDVLHTERFAASRQATAAEEQQGFEVVLERSGVTLNVQPGTSILDAAEEAGVNPLWSCREGLCGTCVVPVIDGVPDHLDDILDDSERDANDQIMICISRSKTPRLVLDL